jgi:predicted amidohydrolase
VSKVIVACAQQQMRLFDSSDSFRREISRFLNMARAKGAQLMVFPPFTGVMASSPRVQGFTINLLKQSGARQRTGGSFWSRTRGAVADGTASLLGANFRKGFVQLLNSEPSSFVADYEDTFAEMARTYEMTIVAGSGYLPDANGVIRHRASVFAADGSLLGRHDKMILSPEDRSLAEPGDAWHVIDTTVGRVGILLGEEALYPESGRILAYQGAELLITLDAVGDEALAAHVRHATIARAQDNRCYALASFVVGRNYMAAEEGSAPTFVGKSGIYAPLEMTPRYSGVLVEMGTADSEGLLTAELDRPKLKWLWTHGSSPVRSEMPMDLFGRYLPALYGSGRSLTDAWPQESVDADKVLQEPGEADMPTQEAVEALEAPPAVADEVEAASEETTALNEPENEPERPDELDGESEGN